MTKTKDDRSFVREEREKEVTRTALQKIMELWVGLQWLYPVSIVCPRFNNILQFIALDDDSSALY